MDKSYLHVPPTALAGTLEHFMCSKAIQIHRRGTGETPPKALFGQQR